MLARVVSRGGIGRIAPLANRAASRSVTGPAHPIYGCTHGSATPHVNALVLLPCAAALARQARAACAANTCRQARHQRSQAYARTDTPAAGIYVADGFAQEGVSLVGRGAERGGRRRQRGHIVAVVRVQGPRVAVGLAHVVRQPLRRPRDVGT